MATQVQVVKPGSSGAGGILGAIGAAIGIIAAPFTGGASLAATAGLASAGSAIGQTVGNLVDPAKGPEDKAVKTGDAMARRAASVTSGDQNQILADSLASVKPPETIAPMESEPVINYANAMKRRQQGLGVGRIS